MMVVDFYSGDGQKFGEGRLGMELLGSILQSCLQDKSF
jgi:hypothetical protein